MIKTLLNFSGGLDSTYVAWDYFQKERKQIVLLHHMNLKSNEAKIRWQLENKSTKEILNYFDKCGYRNYKYIETTIDYLQLGYTVTDADLVFFMTGVLLRKPEYRGINKILMPYSAEDFQKNNYHNLELDRYKLLRIMSKNIQPELVFPIEFISRKELMKNMPEELFKLSWYCRKPLSNGDKCLNCVSCKETLS